jgi:hypothetical protein
MCHKTAINMSAARILATTNSRFIARQDRVLMRIAFRNSIAIAYPFAISARYTQHIQIA